MSAIKTLNSLGWLWRDNGVELCVNLDGQELRVFVPLGRVIVTFHQELAREGFQPQPRVGGYSVAGFFDDVVSAAKSIGKGATRAVSRAASSVTRTAARWGSSALRAGGSALRAVSNNPVWSAIQTGASFVPGMGTAISSGMATAAALGRGESIRDAGLAAARAALPGGPLAAAAFDTAIGIAKGQRFDRIALNAARNQLPAGPARAAFDAGVTAVQHGPSAALRTLPGAATRMLPPAARAALPMAQRGFAFARHPSFGGGMALARQAMPYARQAMPYAPPPMRPVLRGLMQRQNLFGRAMGLGRGFGGFF